MKRKNHHQQQQRGNMDAKDKAFAKNFGGYHPIEDQNSEISKKIKIVREDEDEDEEERQELSLAGFDNFLTEEQTLEVKPYQRLLNEFGALTSQEEPPKKAAKPSKKDRKAAVQVKSKPEQETEEEEEDSEGGEDVQFETYAQEVLCKDNLESEDVKKNDQFSKHFERTIDDKVVEKLKASPKYSEQKLKWPNLGDLVYSYPLEEEKISCKLSSGLKSLHIKQRILDHLNDSLAELQKEKERKAAENGTEDEGQPKSVVQSELLHIMLNYADLYHANVELKNGDDFKYAYSLHALNHILKTRSRIIAHNDKIKQNKSREEIEYRDQGLTRPKVLIVVPFRKNALKIMKMFISLITHKSDQSQISISNKKRFFDAFGPGSDDDDGDAEDAEGKNEDYEARKPEDFKLLFSGNTEDHFKIGLSVAKKSIKLFTEFYSSDIIIASPLGLKSVIGSELNDKNCDHDFLSSIEVLIVDHADVLMMQNWEHVVSIFENLHLQPKASHDTDFSRVRSWLLEGYAPFYRQTIVFSQIPAPPINSLFNKFCRNYAGRFQIDLLTLPRYVRGSICQIGFQLSQVFHKIECESPIDLPEARFKFFTEKILPKFKDDMMSHTLIFIPSYFDYVRLRNYLRKNDMSYADLSEYNEKKAIDKSRFLFYNGRVHFMLVTERFHFYKRYKIRGINHLIFYELPNFADYYSNYCNYLPDPRRNVSSESFSATILYSKFDAQRLCGVVGQQRATHMLNSDKTVHMFMMD